MKKILFLTITLSVTTLAAVFTFGSTFSAEHRMLMKNVEALGAISATCEVCGAQDSGDPCEVCGGGGIVLLTCYININPSPGGVAYRQCNSNTTQTLIYPCGDWVQANAGTPRQCYNQ